MEFENWTSKKIFYKNIIFWRDIFYLQHNVHNITIQCKTLVCLFLKPAKSSWREFRKEVISVDCNKHILHQFFLPEYYFALSVILVKKLLEQYLNKSNDFTGTFSVLYLMKNFHFQGWVFSKFEIRLWNRLNSDVCYRQLASFSTIRMSYFVHDLQTIQNSMNG